MHRTALVFAVLVAPLAAAAVLPSAPAHAQNAAQAEAARQVERDQQQDRITDAARDLESGGPGGTRALVDDLNRQRPGLPTDRTDTRSTSPIAPAETAIPLLSDNPQR
jgi:Ni/Co efflux regulator RcnB